MSGNRTFHGPLASYMEGFLNEKRALGYKYEEGERLLFVLDKMSMEFSNANGLSQELCQAFVEREPNWRQGTQEARVVLIRAFAEYMIRHELPAYMVDKSIITKLHENYKPYIFTHSQIHDIFAAADSIHPVPANSHIFYPVVLRVQYGCGLRISETLGLHMRDVDIKGQTLHVTNAKNNKDRDVPVSGSVAEYLGWYSRKIHASYTPDAYFFKSPNGGGPYKKTTVNNYFRNILFDCGIRHGNKNDCGPHLHNLRHTFCVHSLVAPTKLEDYKIHQDPPGISGSLVEGRICYDAFVLDNKVKAIYYQAFKPKTYTQTELEAMTVDQIKALAEKRGYTITKTVKAEIITEFLADQAG